MSFHLLHKFCIFIFFISSVTATRVSRGGGLHAGDNTNYCAWLGYGIFAIIAIGSIAAWYWKRKKLSNANSLLDRFRDVQKKAEKTDHTKLPSWVKPSMRFTFKYSDKCKTDLKGKTTTFEVELFHGFQDKFTGVEKVDGEVKRFIIGGGLITENEIAFITADDFLLETEKLPSLTKEGEFQTLYKSPDFINRSNEWDCAGVHSKWTFVGKIQPGNKFDVDYGTPGLNTGTLTIISDYGSCEP